MRHPKRGKAIIFNHEKFKNKENRTGTQVDSHALQFTFEQLAFEVEVHNNLRYFEIIQRVEQCEYTSSICIGKTEISNEFILIDTKRFLFLYEILLKCRSLISRIMIAFW